MSPFEVMYGRKCNTPISCDNPIDKVIIGPELLNKMEDHMVEIKQNLKAAQDKQNSYANQNRTTRQLQVGDHVFLKVRPKKSSLNLGNCSKLAARYFGPFEVLAKIGPIYL